MNVITVDELERIKSAKELSLSTDYAKMFKDDSGQTLEDVLEKIKSLQVNSEK